MGLAQRIAETFATKVIPVGRLKNAILKTQDKKQFQKIVGYIAKNKDNYNEHQLEALRTAVRRKAKNKFKPIKMKSKAPSQKVTEGEQVDSATGTTTGSTGQHLSNTLDKDHMPSIQSDEFRSKSDIISGSLSGKSLMSDAKFMQQASRATKAIGGKENLNPHDLDVITTRLLRNKKAQVSLVKKRMTSNSKLAILVKENGGPDKFINSRLGQAWVKKALKTLRENK